MGVFMNYKVGTGFSSFSVDFEHEGYGQYRVLINGVEAFHIYDGNPEKNIQQAIIDKFQTIVDEYAI